MLSLLPRLRGSPVRHPHDKDLALAVTQAYNDWHIDDWCGSYPGRFIPMALPILWDAELCAKEIRRNAEKGCHSLTFTENPATLGFPSFHDEYWDPMWRAASDCGTVVSVHLGSSGKITMTADNAPIDVMITLQPMNICSAAADLLWSRVIKEFPDVRFALSEGGTGWIPYFTDRIDRTYEMHHLWTGQDFGNKLPSEVFRERFLTCFISDPVGIKLRHDIGIDNIAWECDYPHSDSSWPAAPEELAEVTDRRSRRRDQQDHLRKRLPLVQLRPVQAPHARAVHRGRAAGRGRRPRRDHPQLRPRPLRTHRGGIARIRSARSSMSDAPALRVAVVGGSSGLGRCIGIGLAEKGAQVAFVARRQDRLVNAAKEAGNEAAAVVCDVTDAASCQRAVSEIVDAFGGLDAIVYTTGMGVLAPLAEVSADQWAQLFATNVTGASLFTAAAAPHLAAAGGSAVYLSSLSASYSAPWPLLGAYAVSKAALDKLVESWRIEHPEHRLHPAGRRRLLRWSRRLADRVQQDLGPRGAGHGDQILDGSRPRCRAV